ncbi:MAG: M23 family metallopeptidase [Myxococcales bacterium]|jgi:murein DD-endopeptidase MepM/ murein hydrolase activator NlpD|nr:M23 family metallopeptidase [Myxococcales bacterium]
MDWKLLGILAATGIIIDAQRRKARPYHPPVGTIRILREYGGTRRRGDSDDRFHSAIDFELPIGTNVYAAADGIVLSITIPTGTYRSRGARKGYGRFIDVQHDDGLITRYAHMNDFSVGVGERVGRGQVIGHSGETGHVSRRPRLHFEVREPNGTTHDPRKFIRW